MDTLAPEANTAPGASPMPGGAPIDDEQRRVLRQLWQRARDNADDELGRKIARCWRYYDGQVDAPPAFEVGKDEAGRVVYHGSRTVVREVWDKIQAVLPELARVFLSSDEIVAFEPKKRGGEAHAEQATDYANYVFWSENDGEELLLSTAIDWMVKFAALKVFWQTETKDERRAMQVDEEQLQLLLMLANDPTSGITLLDAEPIEMPPVMTPPEMTQGDAPPMMPMTMYRVEMTREVKEGRVCIEQIPQEELLIDPDGMTVDDALMVGQDCYRTVSEVVSWGVPYETVKQYSGKANNRTRNDEATYARRGRNAIPSHTDVGDPALDYVRVVEGIVQMDLDRDGVAERLRVLMLGEDQEPVWIGPGNDCYYVVGSPFRRPHEVIGTGFGEEVADLQDQKTALTRGMLNNFNRAGIPREIVPDDDEVAYSDILSPLKGPIRSANPERLIFHTVPYVGDRAFPLLEYFDNLSATRTGVNGASQGLDPDVLKGQTADGAKQIVTAPQGRNELLTREFAASILRPVFRAILKLSTAFQDKAKDIKLRGQWVTMSPMDWDAEMDCRVKVGLGTGTRPEKLAGILAIKQTQMELLATGSPLVSMKELGETLKAMTQLIGFRDASKFFKEMSDEELAQAMQAAEQSKQEQIQQQAQLAIGIEAAKAEAKAKADAEVDLRREQLIHERETIKAEGNDAQGARDHELKLATIAAQERATLDKQEREMALKERELAMEYELERYKIQNRSASASGNLQQAGSV